MNNSFAEAVEHFRARRGLSLVEIAQTTNYSVSYLSKVVHGRRRLLRGVVEDLDAALHADGELMLIAAAQMCHTDVAAPISPAMLPPASADFVGRERFLHRMDEALIVQKRPGVAVMITLVGGLWVGKTALAIRWAARVQDRFPGGCLYADLRAQSTGEPVDPSTVLDRFLHALGAAEVIGVGSVDDRAAHYRSILADRPALVVLDAIADYEQVQCLLPGARSAVVMTSRIGQSALPLHAGGLTIEVPALDDEEALTLLRRRVGDPRVEVDPVAARTVVHRCGRLPMAINIATARLHRHTGSLRTVADALTDDADLLQVFCSTDPNIDLPTQLECSYRELGEHSARIFTLLSDCQANILSIEAIAAMAGLDQPTAEAAVGVLLHAHLVEHSTEAELDRVFINPIVRAYAHQQAHSDLSATDRRAARIRLLRWYAATALEAGQTLGPFWATDSYSELGVRFGRRTELGAAFQGNHDAAMLWCEQEIQTALTLARHAHRDDRDLGWVVPTLFLPYLWIACNWDVWLTAAHEGLAAATVLGDPLGIARSEQSLGWIQCELGRSGAASHHLALADQLQCEIGDEHSRGWTCLALGTTRMADQKYQQARQLYEQAEALFADADLELGIATARAMLASTYQALGEPERARVCAEDALRRAQQLGSAPAIALGHYRLGLVLLAQQRHHIALGNFNNALALERTNRQRRSEAGTLIARAETLLALGERQQACDSYRDATHILDAISDPRAIDTRTQIAALNSNLGHRGEDTVQHNSPVDWRDHHDTSTRDRDEFCKCSHHGGVCRNTASVTRALPF